MPTTTIPYQLDLKESEIARKRLCLYADERKEIHSQFLGLTGAVTPPVDSLMSQLMLYLQNLPTAAATKEGRIFWEASSFEAWMGMHWLIRKEWLDKYKFPTPLKGAAGIASAKRDTEPLGNVLQALLHLCEKSATVAHFGNYPEYVGGPRLFSAIVVEIAHYGGLANLLRMVYRIEKTPLAQKHEGQSKKNLCRDLSAIVTRINQKELPDNRELFFAQLLAHAVRRAEQNTNYNDSVFKKFIAAMRAYIKHVDSKKCGLVTFASGENWILSMGKSKGYKKLVSRSLSP